MAHEPSREGASRRWRAALTRTSLRSRKLVFALVAVTATAAGSGLLIRELSQEEHDGRAVRALVWEIERKLRAHDAGAWLLVEGAFQPGEAHPAVEAEHDRLRNDLDRLAHLDDLRVVIRDIRVQGDTAWVDYRVEGRPVVSRGGSDPTAGRFTFRRTNQAWVLNGNQFGEGPAVPK